MKKDIDEIIPTDYNNRQEGDVPYNTNNKGERPWQSKLNRKLKMAN